MKNQAIPEIPLTLYHSTYSKNNFETLISFLKKGVLPTMAKGYGQGEGFYVWTTMEKSLSHISFQKERHEDYKGYPIIIVLNETVNPREWDLDYECNANIIIAFLYGHWDLFKSIPDTAIEVGGKYLLISKCYKRAFPRIKNIVFEFLDGSYLSGKDFKKNFGADTEEAALLGTIFNYFQNHFSSKTEKFELSVFMKLTKKGIALKYVGKKPLTVSSFMMEVDGKWLSESETRAFLELKGVKL